MYFSVQLKVSFEVDGKTYNCIVDKMRIPGQRPEIFFRVGANSGNRDLICYNGEWIVLRGHDIPNDVLDALGAGIERAMDQQM